MRFARPGGIASIPSATGGIARMACARLDAIGKDAGPILAKAGVTPQQARDPAIRLEVRTQIRLLELAASELQDEWLGFHLARNFDLREIGLLYYVIASSECLEEALRNAERYSRIMNEGVRLRFGLQDRTATIALDYVDVDRNTDRHQIEFWLVTLVRICRRVTDSRLAPSRLKMRHSRNGPSAEFRAFFGCDVEFGADSDAVSFPAPLASLPVVGRDEYLNELLRRYAEEALERSPRGAVHRPFEGRGHPAGIAAARQGCGIGGRATARDELAKPVPQAGRGGHILSLKFWTSFGLRSPSAISTTRRCPFPKSPGCSVIAKPPR